MLSAEFEEYRLAHDSSATERPRIPRPWPPILIIGADGRRKHRASI